jgi:hypothetical protein
MEADLGKEIIGAIVLIAFMGFMFLMTRSP